LPESKVPWEYQAQRPDTDHFNRDFEPALTSGGTQICRIDIATGASEPLTPAQEGGWDFRQSQSPNGALLLFCRAPTGESPSIWVAADNGQNARVLTGGLDEMGADHPRWLPQ
jgi:hypothetical protein